MTEYHECESRAACDDVREELALARAEIGRLRAALAPFAAVDVDGMISLEEAHLDKEDFHRARIVLTHA